MPGHVDEKLWKESKAAVMPHWEQYREPWAVVEFVYQRKLRAKARGEVVCHNCAKQLARGHLR